MGIYKENMPDLGNNWHCFATKWSKMVQNGHPQQTRGLSMLVSAKMAPLGAKLPFLALKWHF